MLLLSSANQGSCPTVQPALIQPALMTKISNVTNSTDPQAINSRIFVGNLNTFALTKEAVEGVFQRYGRIIGISMHKGYAFVQFTNEYDARKAVAGEDQRIYAGQQIDVNLAAEPKPNRASRKRPPGAGTEWDFYYNLPLVAGHAPLPLPMKRPHNDMTAIALNATAISPYKKRSIIPFSTASSVQYTTAPAFIPANRKLLKPEYQSPPSKQQAHSRASPQGFLAKTEPSADVLICGRCGELFADVDKLLTHKLSPCQRSPTVCSRCLNNSPKPDGPRSVTCATCDATFTSCWELCQHCESQHAMSILAPVKQDKPEFPPVRLSDDSSDPDNASPSDMSNPALTTPAKCSSAVQTCFNP